MHIEEDNNTQNKHEHRTKEEIILHDFVKFLGVLSMCEENASTLVPQINNRIPCSIPIGVLRDVVC